MFTKVSLTTLCVAVLFVGAWLPVQFTADLPVGRAQEKDLGVIKLQLRTLSAEVPKADKVQHKSKEDVEIQVLATNSSSDPVFLVQSSWFVNYLPELSRSGELMPYSKAMQKRLVESRRMEKDLANPNAIVRDSPSVTKLPPNEQRQSARIFLSTYYDKLEPGVYLLKVQYRQPNGTKIESDTVMFEIVP